MSFQHAVYSAIAIVVFGGDAVAQPNGDTARRLRRASNYLRQSAEALYGPKKADAMDFSPKDTRLWEAVRRQHAQVFGVKTTEERFAGAKGSIKDVEERTFDVLEAIWGREWPRVVAPLPGDAKPGEVAPR